MKIHLPLESATRKPWKILIIDDDEDDFLIVKEMLKEAQGNTFEVQWASTYQSGCTALRSDRYNAVLVDYDLGAETGINLIREMTEQGYTVPLILFTGRGTYAVDLEAMEAGATLYLSKEEANPLLLERSIRYAIELKQREQALRASEERFGKAFNASPNAMVISHLEDGRIETINTSFEKLFGYSREEVIGRTSLELNLFANPADREEAVRRLRENQSLHDFMMEIRTKTGEIRIISLFMEIITIGSQPLILTVIEDITERKRAEEALRESESKYRSLYEVMDEGFMLSEVLLDEHERPVDIFYHQVNPAAVRMLGMDYTGKRLTEIDPNFEPYWFEIWDRVVRTGAGERLERYAEPLNTWYNFFIFRVGEPGSRIVANIFEDITHRKQAEAKLKTAAERDAYLVNLTDALRSLSDPVGIQAEAERVLGEYLGASRVMYGEVAEDSLDLIVEQNYVAQDAPLLTGRFRMADFGPALVEALNAGRKVVVPDIASASMLSVAEREAYAAMNIAALAGVPLTKAGRFVANLNVHHAAPHAWTENEIALIEETAERTWAAVERANAEKALRESEERFRSSIESLGEAFKIFSAVREGDKIVDLRYEYVNDAACQLSQHTREQLIGKTMLQHMPQLHGTGIIERFAEVITSGQPLLEQAFTWDFQDPSLTNTLYDIRVTRFGDGIIMTIDDVTELVRLEAERQKSIREREIHHKLAEQRELERQSIARDIHDGPIQTLSSLLFNLQSLREVYPDSALQFEIDRLKLSIKSSVQELRQVMYELRPPSVIQFGLSKAIKTHTENLLEVYPQIEWNLELEDDHHLLPQPTCLMLFRIYQEAVNNIQRHSKASQAWVKLSLLKGQAVLKIEDNGTGFDRSPDLAHLTEKRHFGLAGIAERVEAINGELDIKSNPGEGTVITVKVPIMNEDSNPV